jgi:hypothetical protein
MFRRAFHSSLRRAFVATALLLVSTLGVAQHHGGHGAMGTLPNGSGRPDGVDEKDTLKDFHQAMAVQATSQQISEFQEVMKSTNAAKDEIEAWGHTAGGPTRNGVASVDQAVAKARDANKTFQGGFSETQKSGLKDATKKLEKADSDLAQSVKRLDQAMQSEAPNADLAASADGLNKTLTDFSNVQLALGREMGITLASGQDLTFTLPAVRSPVRIGRQDVVVASSGDLSQTEAQGDTRSFVLNRSVDLTDLQQNLTQIMNSQFDQTQSCGERLAVRHASVMTAPPASSMILQLHFERWSCSRLFGQSASEELAEGDGTVELRLTPTVEDSQLHINPEFKRVDAGGMMAEALRSGDLGEDLRAKAAQTLLLAVRAGADVKSTLPKALQGPVSLEAARFQDSGSGGLKVALESKVKLSNDQVNALANQLNRTLSAQGSATP